MTETLTPNQLLSDQIRLEAVSQYLPVVAAAHARTARVAARAAATPFALVCMVDQTHVHFKAGFGLEIRQNKHLLPDTISTFLPEKFWQTNHPNMLETLNRMFSSKSGWQKHFFAFQASIPLRGADGQILGALIVLDEQIRELDTHTVAMLEDIAESLISELDLRQQLESKVEMQPVLEPVIQPILEPVIQPVLEPVVQPAPEVSAAPVEQPFGSPFDPRKLLDGSGCAAIAETLDGMIMYANQAVLQAFGYTSEELLGANTSELLPSKQVELSPDLLEQLYGGQKLAPVLAKRRHYNRQEIQFYVTYSPIFNQRGVVIGVFSQYLEAPKIPEPVNSSIPVMPAAVFSVNIEGQITACTGASIPIFENPEALIGQLIFKVFQPCNALLEAVCFALLGEEHESTIQLGTQSVRLHLHPVHRVGQPSDVIGIAIPMAH